MKNKLFLKVLLMILFTGLFANVNAQADPNLTMVNTATNDVTISNFGDDITDISDYWVCLGPGQYSQLSSLTISNGDYVLSPNESVTFNFPTIAEENSDGAGGLGLFSRNTFGSTDPSIYVDYMQWGGPNQDRSSQAVTAGVWDSATDFISCPSPYSSSNTGGSSSAWGGADAGTIYIDAAATGNPNNTTSIAADGLSAVICIDNSADPIVVSHNNPGATNLSYRYIITNEDASEILMITNSNSIDLSVAGTGTCQIWGWSYRGLADNGASFVGGPLSELRALETCSDVSTMSITVVREAADAGTIAIDTEATRSLNNTTSVGADELSAVICVDNTESPIVVSHDNPGATNLSYRYVITNEDASEILMITNSTSIDLNGAGTGTCQIWGWSYRGLADNGASFVGGPLSELRRVETCSDVSRTSITVVREAADAGTIAIDVNATRNLNNTTTSVGADGLSAVICVDNEASSIIVSHDNPGATNLSYRYVITNEDASEILMITNSTSIDLNGAGTGTCQIWGWSYRGLADNGASFVGGPLSELRALERCSDVSTMSITVVREAADAGTISIDAEATGNPNNTTSIAADGLSAVICIDNLGDPIVVSHENPGATNLSYRYVVTNEDASEILMITNSTSIDLSGAGTGTCQIWGWSYRGLADNGASFVGGPLSELRALERCSDVSTMSITVIREAADAGTISIDAEATGNPNNTTSIAADGLSAVICIDNLGDPIVVSHDNPGATNLSYRYVVTNEDASEILMITNSTSIDLSGAGTGTCQIWGWSYRGLADNGASFIGGPLSELRRVETCSDVSTMSITVVREAADAGTIAIDFNATTNLNNRTTTVGSDLLSAEIIVGDNIASPIIVSHDNPGATNLSYRYVVTNEDASEILMITNSTSLDLEGAGVGTCQIWGWSYRGLADNGASFVGGPLSELRALETCSDVSTMSITVVRNAEPITDFTATLTGTQENPAALTTAYGEINATLDGNRLTVSGSFTGLTSNFDATVAGGAHIHKAIAGRNGGVELLLRTRVSNDLRSGRYETGDNTFVLTDEQLTALNARELYVNIHSVAFPAGELRGQILPESTQFLQANLLGSNEVPSISTEANGNLVIELDGNQLTVSGSFDDLAGDIAIDLAGGAHIHDAVAGRNGAISIILNLTADEDNRGAIFEAANNSFALTDEQVSLLLAQGNYVNVHSSAFRSGELRGQIIPLSSAVFRSELTGAQEVPAIDSDATGRLVITHDGLGNVTVSGSFNNLSSDLNTALAGGLHLHPGIAGTNAGVDFILTPTVDADNRSAILLPADNTFAFSAEQIETLFSRGYYVNVHSLDFVSGELRGQVLPLARTYLGTNLSGANEIQPVVTSAIGNLQFEITGNQLVVTGGFSGLEGDFDANLAGGSHLHIANAANNGDITILLNATVDADLRGGIYNAVDNTFTIDDAQKASLLSGDIYVNIHTITNAPGELRGQILRDDNSFPEASTITSPENEAIVINDNDANTAFEVSWSASIDANDDLVVYTFQLATDENFENLLINTKVGTDLSFTSDNATITTLLENANLAGNDSVTLYQRVLASDGSVSSASNAFNITITRDSILSVDDFENSIKFSVYPNPTVDMINIQNGSNKSFNVNVELFNMFGRSVYNSSSNLNSGMQVDISSLETGIYLLRITNKNNNTVTTERILKQ